MSPTANDLSHKIGRELQKGDVLVKRYTFDGGITEMSEFYEIVEPRVTGKRKRLLGLLGTQEADCVVVRELTPLGPIEKRLLFSRENNRWKEIILSENREQPSLRER